MRAVTTSVGTRRLCQTLILVTVGFASVTSAGAATERGGRSTGTAPTIQPEARSFGATSGVIARSRAMGLNFTTSFKAYFIFDEQNWPQHLVARPSRISVDNHDALEKLRWTRWGSSSSIAHGLLSYDDCKPYCAIGRQHSVPATVVASSPIGCASARGRYVYTSVVFWAKTPVYSTKTQLSHGEAAAGCAAGQSKKQISNGADAGGSTWSGASAMTGLTVGDCIGIESGDVLDSDGFGDAFGNFFWDPLNLEIQVEHNALGAISFYSNHISIYFWMSESEANKIYLEAKLKGIQPLRRYGNAVMVGYQNLEPLQQHVVTSCLVAGG